MLIKRTQQLNKRLFKTKLMLYAVNHRQLLIV